MEFDKPTTTEYYNGNAYIREEVVSINSDIANWTDQVRDGVGEATRKVIVAVPDILAAVVVFLVGVIVASVLKTVVVRVLKAVRIKPYTDRVGLNQVFTGKFDFAELVGDLVKWFFIVVFLLQALTIAHLEQASDVVQDLLAYVPNVLVAAVLVFVGFVVADLTRRVVVDAARAAGSGAASVMGDVAKYAILTLVTFTALAQLGVNTLFLDRLFTALAAMVAVAGGISFGLGGQDAARDTVEKFRKSFK